jgi:ribosomal protein L7Ae-like RNA K-turn-binding protein
MDKKKSILDLLTICRKAGKLTVGCDACEAAISFGEAVMVLLARDLSTRTAARFRRFAHDANLPVYEINLCLDDLYDGIGKRAGVLAICDGGLAARLAARITDDLSNEVPKEPNY